MPGLEEGGNQSQADVAIGSGNKEMHKGIISMLAECATFFPRSFACNHFASFQMTSPDSFSISSRTDACSYSRA